MFAAREHALLLFVLILFGCLTQGAAWSQMAPLNNEDLRGITGQSGVSISMEGSAQVRMDLFRFSDTQTTPNWIEMHDLNVDNGYGGPFLFSTPVMNITTFVTSYTTYYSALAAAESDLTLKAEYEAKALYTWADNRDAMLTDAKVLDGTIATVMDPITVDIATNSGGITYVRVRETSSINPRRYSVGNFVLNAYSTSVTNTVYLTNTVGHYMTAHSLDNAGLIAAFGLSGGFNSAIPSTWSSDDVTKLAMNNSNPSSVVVNYMTAHSLDNAGLIAALGLSTAFDSTDPTTWTFDDVTKLATETGGDSALITLVSAYMAAPGNFHLQTQPLGSITLDALRQGPSVSRFWAHAGQGISFDYTTAISADALTYAYNTTATGSLKFSKINIAGMATGDPSDPYDANSSGDPWAFSGNFKIGTIGDADNAPATMDVGTDSSNVTSLYLRLPMAGSIRVAEVNFGPNNFGPIAIDGIQFHRLDFKISP